MNKVIGFVMVGTNDLEKSSKFYDAILIHLGMKDVQKEKVRVLFENDEVGFEHAFVSYKDGNKEAVMSYYKFKDGKVAYQETGATKLPK